MVMIYVPVKFEIRLDKAFSSYSPDTEMLTDKQTKNGQTNGQNYTNFERNLAMVMIYVPDKFEIRLDKAFSS